MSVAKSGVSFGSMLAASMCHGARVLFAAGMGDARIAGCGMTSLKSRPRRGVMPRGARTKAIGHEFLTL